MSGDAGPSEGEDALAGGVALNLSDAAESGALKGEVEAPDSGEEGKEGRRVI